MPQDNEKQQHEAFNPAATRSRIAFLGIKQLRIAKELNRKEAAISEALNLKPGATKYQDLLARINRYLDRVERTRAKRQQGSAA